MTNKKHLTVLLALMLAMTAILPVSSALADTATVKGGWLVLRAAPSFSGTILASYPSGTVVTLNGQNGSWYAVTAPDGLSGYMLGDYLQIAGSGNSSSGLTLIDSTAYVTSKNGLNVRLRSGPGKGYSIIGSYVPGTKCTVLSPGNNWCRIQIGAVTGYMMTSFLTGSASPAPAPAPQPQPVTDEYQVYVTSGNGKGVNLRSGPSKSYAAIGFYSVGTPAGMITRGATWSYIRVGNRYGYMMTQFLTEKEPVVNPVVPVTGAYIVSANGRNVNLRSQPSTASSVLRSFKPGTPVTIITRGSEWCFVLINGYYGYMMKQFIYDGVYPATGTDLYF